MKNRNLARSFLRLWRHSEHILDVEEIGISYEEVALAGFKQVVVHLEHGRYAPALNDAEGSIEFLRKLVQDATDKEVIG